MKHKIFLLTRAPLTFRDANFQTSLYSGHCLRQPSSVRFQNHTESLFCHSHCFRSRTKPRGPSGSLVEWLGGGETATICKVGVEVGGYQGRQKGWSAHRNLSSSSGFLFRVFYPPGAYGEQVECKRISARSNILPSRE